jgi:hypothetical protein
VTVESSICTALHAQAISSCDLHRKKNISIDPRLYTYNFPCETFWSCSPVEYPCSVISFDGSSRLQYRLKHTCHFRLLLALFLTSTIDQYSSTTQRQGVNHELSPVAQTYGLIQARILQQSVNPLLPTIIFKFVLFCFQYDLAKRDRYFVLSVRYL